ncbi:uncharacterized protein [Eurosta solidaginis]|uniref:uncharacterized protein n=1 Tax=Eurosta solidaginis TaxID=178769 RepID=UPI0035317631
MLHRHTHFFLTKVLSLLIKQKHYILQRLNQQREQLTNKLKIQLSEKDFKELLDSESNVTNKTTTTLKKRQELKYEKIRAKRNEVFTNNTKHKEWFVNKTKLEFPPDIQALLAKGPKFGLPVDNKNFPLFKYIADGEDLVQSIKSKDQQEEARTKLSLLISNHATTNKHCTIDNAILDTVEQTKKFLNENKNIRILTSDKGNKTVAMEIEEYNKKMEDILMDLTTYRVQRQDPTSRLQNKNNALVEKLFNMEIITKMERKRMITTTAQPPRIYGLPKIHKEGTPLRPICSAIGSPSYTLSKYMADILKNVTASSTYNIKNTIEFKERVNNTYIYEDEKLISFDVVSLFPSIPIQLALEIIQEKWNTIKEYTKIPKTLFMEIIKFCIQESRYFKFNDTIYTQLKGMPMGAPTSPIIADIVMEKLLDDTMLKLRHKPRILTKYVDDLFAIIKENEIQNTLDTLNTFDKNIKFSIELENDEELPYLDSIINRRGNQLKLKWYQKPTASGRIINFNSKHPKTMIMNTAKGCIRKMLQTSDEVYHKEVKKEIFTLLRNNDFPKKTIKTLLRKTKNLNRPKTPDKPIIFKSVAYVPRLSERLAKSDCYDKETTKIAHKPTNTLKNIFNKTKSKIPIMEKNNVVYKIPCKGNSDETCNNIYIGTTKSKLKTRISQHKSDFKFCHQVNNQKTALMAHCADSGHTPNFDETKILQQEQHYNKRFTLEMLHIINIPTNTRLNYKSDVDMYLCEM